MFRSAVAVVSLAALSLVSAAQAQYTFDANFGGTTLDPNFTVVATTGFSASVANGKLVTSKTSGIGNGSVNVVTNFAVTGDFIADTTTSLVNFGFGHNQGLITYAPVGNDLTNLSHPQFDVFFNNSTQITDGYFPLGQGTQAFSQPSQDGL